VAFCMSPVFVNFLQFNGSITFRTINGLLGGLPFHGEMLSKAEEFMVGWKFFGGGKWISILTVY